MSAAKTQHRNELDLSETRETPRQRTPKGHTLYSTRNSPPCSPITVHNASKWGNNGAPGRCRRRETDEEPMESKADSSRQDTRLVVADRTHALRQIPNLSNRNLAGETLYSEQNRSVSGTAQRSPHARLPADSRICEICQKKLENNNLADNKRYLLKTILTPVGDN